MRAGYLQLNTDQARSSLWNSGFRSRVLTSLIDDAEEPDRACMSLFEANEGAMWSWRQKIGVRWCFRKTPKIGLFIPVPPQYKYQHRPILGQIINYSCFVLNLGQGFSEPSRAGTKMPPANDVEIDSRRSEPSNPHINRSSSWKVVAVGVHLNYYAIAC